MLKSAAKRSATSILKVINEINEKIKFYETNSINLVRYNLLARRDKFDEIKKI